MAYATKYLFKWESSNGTTREIRVQKDGYSGSVIQRRLGRAPVLKKQRNGTVFGTSLEFYAECAVDGEFAEFYTSDPKAYKVLLYTGATLLWQGYVTPELYSEPDIAPPYDVQVIATDGIGELKLYDFAAQGVKTLRQMFTYLLGYTGLGTDVYLISSMKAGSSGAGALLDKTINLDYKVGDTCYEVLTYLLDTLHATITWWRGAWIVARETNVTFSSNKVRYYNTSGNSALLTGSVVTLGKMYTNDAWPVGQLTQKIDPAKKSVTIQAPWHVNDAFVNGPMDTDTGWTKTNNASWNSTKKGYNLPDNGQTTDLATVSQSISMLGMRVPMDFVGKFCASLISGQMYNGVAGVAVDYVTSGNVTYHLGKDSEGNPTWVSGSSGNTDYDFQIRLTAVDTDDANAEALSFTIPALAVGTSYPAGTLTVRIVGRSAIVFSASLDVVITKGYQDRLHIDNGARGEEGTVEIAIGRETSDIDYYKAFMQGLLLDSGSLITSFKDDNLTTATDFLSYISRDYARSFALPRIVRTGKVYLEDGVSYPPLVLSKGAVDYWLETFSWDMYEDELDISARSLPTATITVESEVIAEYGTGTASSSSSSGGGATPITPIPSVLPNPYALTFGNKSYDGSEPVTLTASDIGALTGITAAMVNAAYGFTISGTAGSTYNLGNLHTHSNKSVLDGITSSLVTNWNTAYTNSHTHSNKSLLDSMTINWDNYFGIDSDGNVYVKKDGDNPRHFYSYGAVSAGGLSTGGGTSGIDLAAMWSSLQNNDNVDTYDNYQFAAAHLPTCGSGLSYTISNGIATGINVSFPVTSVAGKTGAVTLAFSDITGTASTSQIPDLSGTYLPLVGGAMSNTNLVTNLNADLLDGNNLMTQVSDWNTSVSSIFKSSEHNTTNAPTTDFVYGVHLRFHRGVATYYTDIASRLYADGLYFRRHDENGYGAWNSIWHSGNFNPADYLPLTGGVINNSWTGTHPVDNGQLRIVSSPTGHSYTLGFAVNTTYGYSAIEAADAGHGSAHLILQPVNPDGYVGIGTTTPGYKLDVNGSLNATTIYQNGVALGARAFDSTSYLPLAGGTLSGNNRDILSINSTNTYPPYITIKHNNTSKAYIGYFSTYTTWQNAASGAELRIYEDSSLKFYVSSALANYDVYHSGNSNKSDVAWTCSTLTFSTLTNGTWNVSFSGRDFGPDSNAAGAIDLGSATYRWRTIYSQNLNATGDASILGSVGVGTTSPSYKLHVSGTWSGSHPVDDGQFAIRGVSNNYCLAFAVNTTSGYAFIEAANVGFGAIHLALQATNAAGYVGIGTTSPAYKLDVVGVIHASTGILSAGYITAGSASSREFKDNVRNMSLEYARNIIMSSRPITFQWNALAHSLCDKYEGDGIGFIAQEAEQLMPFAVSPIFEKYKRLDYTAYISPLVRMSQYLLTTTDNHETRIQQLERESKEKDKKIAELENTIARLTN